MCVRAFRDIMRKNSNRSSDRHKQEYFKGESNSQAMKKNYHKYIMGCAMAVSAIAGASAQSTSTAYFLDGYTYGYQMNPAKANDNGFVAFPTLGNINVNVLTSFNLTDFIYNVNGQTTTFLNPGVSTDEFLSKVGDSNRLGVNLKLPVIAFGFNAFGGYNTVTVSARADVGVKLPGSLFRMLKEGVSNDTYDIGAVKANALVMADVAFGHSRQITEDIRVGATVKVLLGGARANVDIKHADLQLGENEWKAVTEGNVELNFDGARFDHDINSSTGNQYISGVDIDGFKGLSGFGLGVDLGAEWAPSFLPDFKFSAALLDLGYMSWKNTLTGSTKGQHVFNTNDYTFNVDKDAPNSFDHELDRIGDEITALYELYDEGNQGGKTTGIGTTFNIGAEYTLPVYKALSVGVLNTTRMQQELSWTEFRAVATWEPCKVFDAAVSLGTGTFGSNFGWIANLHAPGFNLFLGMDRIPAKFGKPMIPMNDASLNFGLNFLF